MYLYILYTIHTFEDQRRICEFIIISWINNNNILGEITSIYLVEKLIDIDTISLYVQHSCQNSVCWVSAWCSLFASTICSDHYNYYCPVVEYSNMKFALSFLYNLSTASLVCNTATYTNLTNNNHMCYFMICDLLIVARS